MWLLQSLTSPENNDGIFMVASTNHLDQLDPGLSSRPSRFDRKYLFPLPATEERVLYCDYWRTKLASKPSIKFPRKLSPAIAGITQDFSFAYLKEAFVSTLLAIAGNRSEDGIRGGGDEEGGDLDDYELWREMKRQVKLLRDDMDTHVMHGLDNSGFVEDLSWKDLNYAEEAAVPLTLPAPVRMPQSRLPYRTRGGCHGLARSREDFRLADRKTNFDTRQPLLVNEDGKFLE